MKTAQYIVRQCTDFKQPLPDLIELIKEYAKQVAEQALKDASERATYIRIGKLVSINPDSITNTEIKTP